MTRTIKALLNAIHKDFPITTTTWLKDLGYIKKEEEKPERKCMTCRDDDLRGHEEPCNTCIKLDDSEGNDKYPIWVAKS